MPKHPTVFITLHQIPPIKTTYVLNRCGAEIVSMNIEASNIL